MARQFFPIEGSNGLARGFFEFSFVTNGTGAVDQTTIRGRYVTSVTRSAAGKFTVVLDGAFYETVLAEAFIMEDAAASSPRGLKASVQVPDETANPYTLVVWTMPVGSATATDYGTGATDTTPCRVCVRLTFKTTIGA